MQLQEREVRVEVESLKGTTLATIAATLSASLHDLTEVLGKTILLTVDVTIRKLATITGLRRARGANGVTTVEPVLNPNLVFLLMRLYEVVTLTLGELLTLLVAAFTALLTATTAFIISLQFT